MVFKDSELKSIIYNNSRKALEVEEIENDTMLYEDLGYDSISMVVLIIEIESFYSIELDSDLLIDVKKYSDLKNLVMNKIN